MNQKKKQAISKPADDFWKVGDKGLEPLPLRISS